MLTAFGPSALCGKDLNRRDLTPTRRVGPSVPAGLGVSQVELSFAQSFRPHSALDTAWLARYHVLVGEHIARGTSRAKPGGG